MEESGAAESRNKRGHVSFRGVSPIQLSCQNRVFDPSPTFFLTFDLIRSRAGLFFIKAEIIALHGPPWWGVWTSTIVVQGPYPYLREIVYRHKAFGSQKNRHNHLNRRAIFLLWRFPKPSPPRNLGRSIRLRFTRGRGFFFPCCRST